MISLLDETKSIIKREGEYPPTPVYPSVVTLSDLYNVIHTCWNLTACTI